MDIKFDLWQFYCFFIATWFVIFTGLDFCIGHSVDWKERLLSCFKASGFVTIASFIIIAVFAYLAKV